MENFVRKTLILVYLLIIFSFLRAQNYAPNYGFEVASCPNNWGQIYRAVPWRAATLANTVDYYNTCGGGSFNVPNTVFGYQTERAGGNGFAGIVLYSGNSSDYREYLQVQLISPLVAGITYDFTMYTNLGDYAEFLTDDLGVYFSDTAITGPNTTLPVVPQIENPSGNFLTDTVNWMLISGSYLATGGEEYITIGNFKDNANISLLNSGAPIFGPQTCYYYIDDVCVTPQGGTGCLTPLPIELISFSGENKGQYNFLKWETAVEINNDYFTLEKSDDTHNWSVVGTRLGAGNSNMILSYSMPDNNPYQQTYYRLKQTDFDGKYEYSNVIVITNKIYVSPNPFENSFTIRFPKGNGYPVNIEVLDYIGRKVYETTINTEIQQLDISLAQYASGNYFVKVFNDTQYFIEKVVKK